MKIPMRTNRGYRSCSENDWHWSGECEAETEAEDAVVAVIDALGIEYMVVGSLSSNFYGVPRSTEDADCRRCLPND